MSQLSAHELHYHAIDDDNADDLVSTELDDDTSYNAISMNHNNSDTNDNEDNDDGLINNISTIHHTHHQSTLPDSLMSSTTLTGMFDLIGSPSHITPIQSIRSLSTNRHTNHNVAKQLHTKYYTQLNELLEQQMHLTNEYNDRYISDVQLRDEQINELQKQNTIHCNTASVQPISVDDTDEAQTQSTNDIEQLPQSGSTPSIDTTINNDTILQQQIELLTQQLIQQHKQHQAELLQLQEQHTQQSISNDTAISSDNNQVNHERRQSVHQTVQTDSIDTVSIDKPFPVFQFIIVVVTLLSLLSLCIGSYQLTYNPHASFIAPIHRDLPPMITSSIAAVVMKSVDLGNTMKQYTLNYTCSHHTQQILQQYTQNVLSAMPPQPSSCPLCEPCKLQTQYVDRVIYSDEINPDSVPLLYNNQPLDKPWYVIGTHAPVTAESTKQELFDKLIETELHIENLQNQQTNTNVYIDDIEFYQRQLAENNELIDQLRLSTQQLQVQLSVATSNQEQLNSIIKSRDSSVNELNQHIHTLEQQLSTLLPRIEHIESVGDTHSKLTQEIIDLRTALDYNQQQLVHKNNDINELNHRIIQLNNTLQQHKDVLLEDSRLLVDNDATIDQLNQHIQLLTAAIESCHNHTHDGDELIVNDIYNNTFVLNLNNTIHTLQQQVTQLNHTINDNVSQTNEFNELSDVLDNMLQHNKKLQYELHKQTDTLYQHNNTIYTLNEQLQQYTTADNIVPFDSATLLNHVLNEITLNEQNVQHIIDQFIHNITQYPQSLFTNNTDEQIYMLQSDRIHLQQQLDDCMHHLDEHHSHGSSHQHDIVYEVEINDLSDGCKQLLINKDKYITTLQYDIANLTNTLYTIESQPQYNTVDAFNGYIPHVNIYNLTWTQKIGILLAAGIIDIIVLQLLLKFAQSTVSKILIGLSLVIFIILSVLSYIIPGIIHYITIYQLHTIQSIITCTTVSNFILFLVLLQMNQSNLLQIKF